MTNLIRRLRDDYQGFRAPAEDAVLTRLNEAVGPLPDDVLALYRDHDGSEYCPESATSDGVLPARLMPIEEAIETQPNVRDAWLRMDSVEVPAAGEIAWLWTDDNSNYVGVYTSGPLRGWLTKLNHAEPILTPSWRSVAGLLENLLNAAPGVAAEDEEAWDLVMTPREVPATEDDPRHVEGDRQLVRCFRELHENTEEEDRRMLYAMCAICLTPVADTQSVFDFLWEEPEAAIELLEVRHYRGPAGDIERLACTGRPYGDSAAMRLLVRMGTPESEQALARLDRELHGDKRKSLDLWLRSRLLPPRR